MKCKITTQQALAHLHVTPVKKQIENHQAGKFYGVVKEIDYLFSTNTHIYAMDDISYVMYSTAAWKLV